MKNLESSVAVLPQNLTLNRISKDHVVGACARIAQLVEEIGATGLDALSIKQQLYAALYEALLQKNAPSNALEYVEVRNNAMNYEIDLLKSGTPDLFEQRLQA